MLARLRRTCSTLRTLEDARRLRTPLADGGPLLVIGAGFIGQEVAAAARSQGMPTTIVEAAPAPLAGLLGPELGALVQRAASLHAASSSLLGEQVAEVHGEERVRVGDAEQAAASSTATTCSSGVGIEPDVDWLAGSPLAGAGVRTDMRRAQRRPGRLRRRRRRRRL